MNGCWLLCQNIDSLHLGGGAAGAGGFTRCAGPSRPKEKLPWMPLLIGSALCPAPTEGHSTGVTAVVKSQLGTHPMGGQTRNPQQRRETPGKPRTLRPMGGERLGMGERAVEMGFKARMSGKKEPAGGLTSSPGNSQRRTRLGGLRASEAGWGESWRAAR